MHHLRLRGKSFDFYLRHQEKFLKLYIALAKITRIPLIGFLVKKAANFWAKKFHSSYLLTKKEALEIIENSNFLTLGICACRKVFQNCQKPRETCFTLGTGKDVFLEPGIERYQQIPKERAKEVIENCSKQGLITSLVRCQKDFYAICNCCQCCCVPTRLKRDYKIDYALIRDEEIVEKFKNKLLAN